VHCIQLSPDARGGEDSVEGEEERRHATASGEEVDESPCPLEEDQEDQPEISSLNRPGGSLAEAAGGGEAASDQRPRLIINIMSGLNDEKSVVMGHEEVEPGEEHDRFHDIPGPPSGGGPNPPVILRHPRVPPLHGETRLVNICN
jgi:hypothetical protein